MRDRNSFIILPALVAAICCFSLPTPAHEVRMEIPSTYFCGTPEPESEQNVLMKLCLIETPVPGSQIVNKSLYVKSSDEHGTQEIVYPLLLNPSQEFLGKHEGRHGFALDYFSLSQHPNFVVYGNLRVIVESLGAQLTGNVVNLSGTTPEGHSFHVNQVSESRRLGED